ncbi:MAG: hypothetical protein KDN22_32615 [Verrucomicrobiae bacterium]|nr:hypothetical protein [Verrucomicrobiae bacterium]
MLTAFREPPPATIELQHDWGGEPFSLWSLNPDAGIEVEEPIGPSDSHHQRESVAEPPLPDTAPIVRVQENRPRDRGGRASSEEEVTNDERAKKWRSFPMAGRAKWVCLFVLVGCLAAVVFDALGVIDLLGNSKSFSAKVGVENRAEHDGERSYGKVRSALMMKAHAMCWDYSRAKTWNELQPVVRNWERVQPLMRRFYKRKPFPAKELDRLSEGIVISLPDDPRYGSSPELIVFNGRFIDDSPVQFVFVTTASGPKIDWEGMVGYNLMSLADFKSAHPTLAQPMRVRVAEGGEHGGIYDEAEFVSLRLTHPDERNEVLYGNVRRASALAEEFEEIFRSSKGREQSMTLTFAYADQEQSGSRQVEITGIYCRGWVW